MSAREVVQLVTNTTVDVGPQGRDDMTGFGAISLRRALQQKVPANAPNPVYERLDKVAQASPSSAAGPSSAEEGDDGGSGNLMLITIVGVVLVGLALVGVPLSIAHDRRKKRERSGGPPPPPPGGPGMPPSFGAPQGGGQQPHPQGPYGPPPGQQPPYPPYQGG